MHQKEPPNVFSHEFLHDIYQTVVSSLSKHHSENSASSKKSDCHETKQDNKHGEEDPHPPKVVACLVFSLFIACLVAAVWHSDSAALCIIAIAVGAAFQQLISSYLKNVVKKVK